MNLQKNEESTKENNSVSKIEICNEIYLLFFKFSNIGSIMRCCQMSKANAGYVDFLTQTNLIGL
jgi:hypothetical protein